METQDTVASLVRKMETDYTAGETTISKYVSFNQYENINKIDAYLNSKFTEGGDMDSLDRPKPFFNIVTAAVNIWYRATDIDRKNIRIKATKREHYIPAFLYTIHLQNWMRKHNFGIFLNEWGRSLARYGSIPVKFVEKDGELYASVIPWNRMISDTIDFENNPKIEVLEITPAQLRKSKYDKEAVKALLDTRTSRENLDRTKKDNKSEYIKIYEVHGELPLSYLTGKEEDKDEYVQQMHVVSFVMTKGGRNPEYEDFTLYKGKEKQDPYMLTHLIKEDGRAQSIGAVEHLFDAQWMVNHTAKQIKDQLDLASQLIFQTADGSFVGRNVLSQVLSGDILIHEENKPLTQLANNNHDITALQAFGSQWQALAKEITSTPDSISGNTMPSGTAYRQVAILNQESHSLFEIMTENKGLQIEEMMRRFVLPHHKKKLDTTEEIAATLDSQGITQIDSMYVPNKAIRLANRKKIDTILSGEIAEEVDTQALENDIRKDLSTLGNQRFLNPSDIDSRTWKEVLDEVGDEVEVEVTNESTDKEAVMTTLTTVLQTIASNPMILQDPNMKMLFNKILEETGKASPVELAQTSQPQMQQPLGGGSSAVPVMQGVMQNASI